MTKEELALRELEVYDEMARLDVGEADITTREIDFDGVDADLVTFQRNEIVQEALSKGVDLRSYSRVIERDLREEENACVREYISQADALADLHSTIRSCDSTLDRMEGMLVRFQDDLGHISSEIVTLQEQSMSMSIKLKNRRSAEKRLASFVRHVDIQRDMHNIVMSDGELTEQLGLALAALSRMLYFMQVGLFV